MGLKVPDIRLTGEENTGKTSPRKLVPTGDRIQARCVIDTHSTACSTARRWTSRLSWIIKLNNFITSIFVKIRGQVVRSLAHHRWGLEFTSQSLNVDFLVDESRQVQFFADVLPFFPALNFIPLFSPLSPNQFSLLSFNQRPCLSQRGFTSLYSRPGNKPDRS